MEEDFELDGLYTILDGKLMKDLSELDIPFTGIGPTNGIMKYTNGELTRACLTFDDYKVTYDGSTFISEKGTCLVTRQIAYTDEENNVGYYNAEWIERNPIYYNPVTGESCTDYHEDNSKTGYNGLGGTGNQTECLKWYAYSEQNGNINLLLDHDTTATIAWVTEDDYNKSYDDENGAQSLGITYPNGITGTDSYGSNGNWNKGPITLLNQLKTDTDGWSGVQNRTDSYTNKSSYKNSGNVTERYTINYSGYKARLITAGEIPNIVGFDSWDEKTSSGYFYFDSQTSSSSPTCTEGNTTGCLYGWLHDRTSTSCTIYGCLNNSDIETYGYWTVSSYASRSERAWRVGISGALAYGDVNNGSSRGLRPVITVSTNDIFES